ncbi:E3 ubiquitin-protein ligase rnf213-alpha-like [Dendronephthya gigantea]|uniref:E3 ubiquitin-protein ligase rnf213-alpha-like n=1 Tax=Dendronephthya gigantea TaxID=151771 RepID=UPI00106AD8F8|nr:E3 ubiquitin-protein ligase rnf213-alpha-like [Dendronephthya gigantea]
MLEKSWPRELKGNCHMNEKERGEVLLRHLLTWSIWPGFLKFFGNSTWGETEVTESDSGTILVSAVSCVENVVNSVNDGTVTAATLKVLREHSKQFLELCEVHQTNQSGSQHVPMRTTFETRLSELREFHNLNGQLKCFLDLCSFKRVDEVLRALSEKIVQDFSELSIRDICVQRSGRFDVIFFNLDDKYLDMVSRINEIESSRIFVKLWRKYSEKLQNEQVTMENILQIWIKVCEQLEEISEQFGNGEMLLKDIDKYLDLFQTNYTDLEGEFKLLFSFLSHPKKHLDETERNLAARITQVKRYKKISDARQAGKAILQLKETLRLTGDFSVVEKIEEIISGNLKDVAIKDVDGNLLKAGELLDEIDEKRRGCLTTFTECFDLVAWLKKSINDEQELKVFVDLALISAGEDDMEIDRISCMHTSCLGFGSLIFGYKTSHGFDELMRLCQPVWHAVDANPGIGEKLVSTKKSLSWLKQIKESHGSVALTTMVQVEAINSCGTYYIADTEMAKEVKYANAAGGLNFENLVCLNVPEDPQKNRERKVYSLEEIKDVQSKLMLIAGKAESGKEEVDKFNEIFDGILRISHLYLQLCEVGQINYLTWKSKYQCSKADDERNRLLENIEETCETMERDLKKWKEYFHDARNSCYSLNHFTMKQILHLRLELAKVCVGHVAIDELRLQTFMLLESVNKNVEPLLLANVLKTMVPENVVFFTEKNSKDGEKYFESDMECEGISSENIEEDVTFPSQQRRKISLETFMSAKEKLEGMGERFKEKYLVAALQICGRYATEEDLIAHVVFGEEDKETVMKYYEDAKRNPQLSDLIADLLNSECQSGDAEESKREIIGQKIDRKPVTPYVKNKEDTYLSLEILTDILDELSESAIGAESQRMRRKMPSGLMEGEPNLLLVPKAEVFGCLLSLFMGNEARQPLPTDEEVIVCNENTTAEEIELLWRRAVVDDKGQLFCLANADLLDYDVSQQVVRSLELLTQGQSKYHLVVICSIENEDRSNMVTSLDQNRRHFPPIPSTKAIQNYLKEQLMVSGTETVGNVHLAPAATVDVEKLSVRVIQSSRAGMGKSLFIKHLAEQLENLPSNKKLRKGLVPSLCATIPVHGISVDSDCVTREFLSHAVKRDIPVSRIFHLDMSQSVVKGLDNILFQLLILRVVKDKSGNVWRRKSTDMYVVEITTDKSFEALTTDASLTNSNYSQTMRKRLATEKYSFVKYLPRTHCSTPRETLDNIRHNRGGNTGFDMEKFRSEEYQRTFQYLTQFAAGQNLDKFLFIYDPRVTIGDPVDALTFIIKYCGIRDPSWAELHHFVNFLNVQLRDCEESVFCNAKLAGDLLQGFKTFVVRFMIEMSRDFATRSLSDSNLGVDDTQTADEDDDLAPFEIRKRWELSPHPYIFFNHDRVSMTFLGFRLSDNGDLLDPATNKVLEQKMMEPTLRGQLKHQGVNFDTNYEKRDKMARIEKLCSVMGIEFLYDPDPTYELTTDNVKKILAIHMRFRCGIPVIIMGETGCGKTRLIRFMCELQAGPDGPKNLLLMKVHGGTSYAEIEKKVVEAEKRAFYNQKNEEINVDTVLFFDEANTTDAIDLIKEIMVDRRVNGRAINPALTKLHFIAACNPYRKHTKKMIQKLESAGLGYHVSADETDDKLGSIPLRQLVYRVHPLPESMRPLVWDFGRLTDHTEELYAAQIVRRSMVATTPDIKFDGTEAQASCIATVLSASQKYMREQKNECSFVSLRDVERAMKVITWFYSNSELIIKIIGDVDGNGDKNTSSEESSEEEDYQSKEEFAIGEQPLSQIARALILGIGVCYYARLNTREEYCQEISRYFDNSCPLPGGGRRMQREIERCQRGFLNGIQVGQNIAKNIALSENVFMMAICTELRIPLFVVGKPGSSKSLAKDVISTNMKAGNSQSELFKNLKQIHMQSYQCSPLSTPEGIVSTFKQCAKLQKDKDLKKFVSVVVLDEIGLAEDSPLMPLKTLHPLLEDGTATTEESGTTSDHHRVGFIGLSNWSLDPAKMNRGIMLSRGVPNEKELQDSASGICSSRQEIKLRLETTVSKLCKGYFKLYEEQSKSDTLKKAQKDEFFGLRDFYSLVKMVFGFAVQKEEQGDQISVIELEKSIRRNFSGLDDIDPVKTFCEKELFPRLKETVGRPSPECFPVNLIQESLVRTEKEGESRYLLVLTENYAALRLLQGQFYEHDPVIIFGSSFPKDQRYTQICRNINRIKVCMETGKMVILLNLESLYESLYDALNQYYVYLANQKYVDLGLGNHRVKCRVANEFKLIVVAEKDVVYRRFPIPLINRLEKHLLVMSTGLTKHQAVLVEKLQEWVEGFSEASPEFSCNKSLFKPGDCFVGYHSDTAAAVIIKIEKDSPDDQILLQSKLALLQCASPDAIARLPATRMKGDAEKLWNVYFKTQRHGSLKDYLVACLDRVTPEKHGSLIQITTHSRLLSPGNSRSIASDAGFKGSNARCISLQEFHTEQQFTKTLEEFFVSLGGAEGLLLVQCDNGEANSNLIACCRHLVDDTRRRKIESFDGPVKPIHVVFIIQLPKIAGGCQHFVGFQGGKWQSIHIDELLESSEQLPQIEQLMNRSVSDLFKPVNLASSDDIESMDVDEHYDGDVRMEDIKLEQSDKKRTALSEIKAALLLKNCLQAAAARIYDESAEIDRATKRIEILLEFLPEDDTQETDLSQILASRVYGLLVERDEKCFQDQKLWLQHEALSQGHLQETGTFRKALWQKLSSIVSPILSEVIAFCDRNYNLNIPHEGKEWKSRLWFWMLSEVQITPLTYDSFISPESQRIRERAFVQNTGVGHPFNGKFPFSWIIKDIVSDLLIKVAGDLSKTLLQLRGIFYQSPLGNYLKVIFGDKENKKEATENYLHDFLHMMYKPIENGELELIYDAFFEASGQIHQLLHENEDFDIDIPFIHFTYSLIEARLANFSELVHAFPGLVKELIKLGDRLKVGEMILDTVALEYCLQKLEPTPKDLESIGNRSCWCNRVQRVGPVVKVLKNLKYSWNKQQNKDGDQAGFVTRLFGEKSIVIFEECRMMWIRLDVVRMFIEHTCPPGQRTYAANAQNAFILWKVLGENLDFSTVRTMTAIERFLKDCCERISKRFIRYDITQCEICKRPLRDPILMPCDHTCCMPCARGWFKDHNACPMCRKEVGNDFKVVANKKCRDALEMYNNFRNRCKSFFVELVSLYCFRKQLPEPDLVRKFINYVINDENKTEAFTPFGGQGIDVTPVIRSYILQQLLAIKERRNEVLEYLEEYLRRAKGLGEREHLIEVCVLCVQCMEDVETVTLLKAREGGENVQLNIASRILDRSLRNISSSSNTLTVSCLEDIAGIRSALEVVSSYLSDDFADNVKRFPKLSNCLASAKQLCSRFVVKLFLLKQLVRHDPNGIDAVKERCRKEELNWIMPPQSEEQDKTPDPFIVHRDEYHTVREALGKAFLTSSLDNLRDVLQNLQIQPPARWCYILLALFREVTTSFGHSNKDDRIPSKVLKTLKKYITGIKDLPNEVRTL